MHCAGNAPVMIHKDLLETIVEDWYDIALRMKNDEKANKAFGWILEMVRDLVQSSGSDPHTSLWLSFDLHLPE